MFVRLAFRREKFLTVVGDGGTGFEPENVVAAGGNFFDFVPTGGGTLFETFTVGGGGQN